MSTVKVKEMKDDAILSISVNKSYYLMVKAVLYDLFSSLQEKGTSQETLQNILKKPYAELSQPERSFFTITLLLAEIEKQATENNLFDEKDFNAEEVIKKVESSED